MSGRTILRVAMGFCCLLKYDGIFKTICSFDKKLHKRGFKLEYNSKHQPALSLTKFCIIVEMAKFLTIRGLAQNPVTRGKLGSPMMMW